jgi:hypothetical protein
MGVFQDIASRFSQASEAMSLKSAFDETVSNPANAVANPQETASLALRAAAAADSFKQALASANLDKLAQGVAPMFENGKLPSPIGGDGRSATVERDK